GVDLQVGGARRRPGRQGQGEQQADEPQQKAKSARARDSVHGDSQARQARRLECGTAARKPPASPTKSGQRPSVCQAGGPRGIRERRASPPGHPPPSSPPPPPCP